MSDVNMGIQPNELSLSRGVGKSAKATKGVAGDETFGTGMTSTNTGAGVSNDSGFWAKADDRSLTK